MQVSERLGAWLDGPRGKPDPAVLRVAPLEETERRARAAAPRVPITRLADLGPLDRGRPFVFSATTPLAADLTTHLGKGATPRAARVSALMEAIERASAEALPAPGPVGAFETLRAEGQPVVDPRRFALPPGTAFRPDRPIRWAPARRLPDGAPVLLAADLVLSPPGDGVILQPDTNGLASGNTLAEAILHGLCEVIERDALGRDLFARLYGDPGEGPAPCRLDLATLPEAPAALAARIAAAGHRLDLVLHPSAGVPVLSAWLEDPAWPGAAGTAAQSFFGVGCAPDPALAAVRALTEAQQGRVAVLQGARDSFNEVPGGGRPAPEAAGPALAWADLPAPPATADLFEDLAHVLGRLAAAGLPEAYAADLTDPRLGLPVVRVRVPGLSVFLVDRSRVGPRDLACLA